MFLNHVLCQCRNLVQFQSLFLVHLNVYLFLFLFLFPYLNHNVYLFPYLNQYQFPYLLRLNQYVHQ
jgi:hypothetical protein